MNIEAEIRSFISESQYNKLLAFFAKNAELIKNDYQESFYFDCDEDLRIQRNNFYSKVWLKKGKMHDESREEIEIQMDKNDFKKLEKLFLALGYDIEIKWLRERKQFKWGDVTVCLDYSKGYGYIIELEKICHETDDKEDVLKSLKQKLESLDVEITPREEFDKQYKYYKENWRELLKM